MDSKIIIIFFAFQTVFLWPVSSQILKFGASINLKTYATEINVLVDDRSPMYLEFKERLP